MSDDIDMEAAWIEYAAQLVAFVDERYRADNENTERLMRLAFKAGWEARDAVREAECETRIWKSSSLGRLRPSAGSR